MTESVQSAVPEIPADGAGETRVATSLSDGEGNEVSTDELKNLVGIVPDDTIGMLHNMTTIGVGGIGSVFSAHEPVLNREIAIKILRPAYRNQLNYVAGFIREARITAQIDHPNVIPVHRMGVFDDAGVYFTMKRVVGVTLSHVLRELKSGNHEMQRRYTRHRLLEVFISVCNGVAFAHNKGIVHRDLKPSNIMIGDYGEVFVVDWGLALYRAEHDNSHRARKIELGELPGEEPVENADGKVDKVSGTPAFMAPEQAAGEAAKLDEQTDVYALGAILYSILTWEQSPFEGGLEMSQLMEKVVRQKFLRPRRRAPRRRIPYELEAITLKAMAGKKSKRYGSVKSLLDDVRNYLDKYPVSAYSPLFWYRLYKLIRRRPLVPVTLLVALLTLGIWHGATVLKNRLEAQSLLNVAQTAIEESTSARNLALSTRAKLNDFYAKSGNTETLGGAIDLKSRYLRARDEFEITCNNAWELLSQLARLDGNMDVAGPAMAELLTSQLEFAAAAGNQAMIERVINRLRRLSPERARRLYALQPKLGRQMAIVEHNRGDLELVSDWPGMAAEALFQGSVDPQGRNIRGTEDQDGIGTLTRLAPAPSTTELRAGQYTIIVPLPVIHGQAQGNELRFPVIVRPGTKEKIELRIPAQWPPDMVYVPEGAFIFGNRTFDDQPARMRLGDFFIARHEVTFGEYLRFWKSLTSPELRDRYQGFIENTRHGRQLLPLWDAECRLRAPYTENMPVIGVSPAAMEAYCRYMSGKTGFKYRLPTALEWEKAARGVDGREYVWGAEYHSNWANIPDRRHEAPAENLPAEVGKYPKDVSVYDIYDLTGNARELVTNPNGDQYYTVKGGSFASSPRFARAAENAYASVFSDVGFRCVVEPPVKPQE